MRNDPVHTEMYKKFQINIYTDEDCESPDDWGNDDLFLVGYHRDFTVDHGHTVNRKHVPGITKELAIEIYECLKNTTSENDANSEALEYIDKYHIFGLEAYIHSGVVLALSNEGTDVDRRWDVSQLGLVFVSKKEWEDKKDAREAARSLIKIWNQYLSGEVYGFMIGVPYDPDDDFTDYEERGGCWGFYGDYNKEDSDIILEAKAEIDGIIEECETEFQESLKGQDLIEVY